MQKIPSWLRVFATTAFVSICALFVLMGWSPLQAVFTVLAVTAIMTLIIVLGYYSPFV